MLAYHVQSFQDLGIWSIPWGLRQITFAPEHSKFRESRSWPANAAANEIGILKPQNTLTPRPCLILTPLFKIPVSTRPRLGQHFPIQRLDESDSRVIDQCRTNLSNPKRDRNKN